MITYWPIILDSTESKYAIWLEARSSWRMPNPEYLDLSINYSSHTFEHVKFDYDFYSHAGTNEGFDNAIHRAPVLRTQLDNMAKEIIAELGVAQTQSVALKLKYEFAQNEMDKLIFLVHRAENQPNFSFQISYCKENFKSIFQIQTSAERILKFIEELIEKIEKAQ